MAEARTLARPYARAAFELARDQQILDAWSRALAFAAAVSADPGVVAMRGDPRIEHAALVDVHLPADAAADGEFGRLLMQMAEHRRLALLPEVAELFDAFKRDAEATLKVTLTSAQPLDEAQRERLVSALRQRYQRGIELETRVDATLLGGAIVDAGGEVIDGTVRERLSQLAATLTH